MKVCHCWQPINIFFVQNIKNERQCFRWADPMWSIFSVLCWFCPTFSLTLWIIKSWNYTLWYWFSTQKYIQYEMIMLSIMLTEARVLHWSYGGICQQWPQQWHICLQHLLQPEQIDNAGFSTCALTNSYQCFWWLMFNKRVNISLGLDVVCLFL